MTQTKLVELDDQLALAAADIRLETRLSMTESFVLAVVRRHGTKIITSDLHF